MHIVRQKKTSPRIEVSPLLDCIFLLLIFFMLTARMSQPSMPIDLPEGSTEGATPPNAILLSISDSGTYSIDGAAVDSANLVELIRARISVESPIPVVVIRGDKNAPYGQVFRALEDAKAAGAPRVEVAYERKSEG